jgi:FKBP-type peptidyl-prolyl cis-trans isomerase
MKRKNLLVAALAAATLCGCVSLPPYTGPAAGEPTAIVDTSRVKPTSICTNGTLYSVKAPRDNKLVIPASGRVALYSFVELYDYNVTYSCGPGISFKPANGVSYLLNMEIEDQVCRLEIYRQGGKNRTGLDLEMSIAGPQYCKSTAQEANTQKSADAFLAAASAKPGVVQLPSGVRYLVLEAGTGKLPGTGEVVVDMRAETAEGKIFLDTKATGEAGHFRIAQLPLTGLREAIALMPVGSRWEIYLPSDLAFGDSPKSPVGPGQAVKFTVKLNSAE